MRIHRTSPKQNDVRSRMLAAGFSAEEAANEALVERITRLLAGSIPKPPAWHSGDGATFGAEIGDYGAVNTQTAAVVWDDRKFAECYTNEDASWLAALLKALYPSKLRPLG